LKFSVDRKKLVIGVVIVILVVLFFYFDLGRYLTIESLKNNRDLLAGLYSDNRFVFVALFIVIYIVQTALALPGAAVLTLAAGAIFGAVMGTVYANIGATIGATLSFLVARYLFHDTIQSKFGPKLQRINNELDKAGFNYLLFLRLVPIFPFFLINLAAGLTRIRLRTFILGTMLGIIPGGFVYCNAGASLASINSVGEIASFRVLGSLALLGLFALTPVFYAGFKRKRKNLDHGS
jgi:uncharacterized membrane protein YdjX (TVP38/TMEM64 family)